MKSGDMVDIVAPDKRSYIMSRVRNKNTGPEMIVRSAAHGLGLRFRLHRRDLPGSPDLIFPKHHLALFVHGCFWHSHEGCKLSKTPKSNVEFWEDKFLKNVQRDKRNYKELRDLGWRVGIIWQCESKSKLDAENAIKKFLME
jgi:DNA mismatch endonuclease, patch repair protein